ncbi:YfhO family protein [Streptococcus suis]|nr:YfhO family protein [Streptococcus suis]HEL9645518.1 YfhO family protein [Streptococcus suis]
MMTIQLFFKKHVFHLLAFFLPLTIIASILALKGIWWGSDTTILASDGFHQYVIFNQTLRNALHGDGSLFYTFTSGLGLNFYALSSYYLGSFLSPLVFFFNLKTMPDALYLFTLIKFGLTGLSTYISLKGIYSRLQPILVLILSTSFSLMSFATSQLEINNWLDIFILVPLILLGLHKLLEGRNRILYFISLTCLFIQNYYFGYMTALFIVLWFLVQLSWDFSKRKKFILDFTLMSILAGISSLIMLLPAYLDLKTHGETFTEVVKLQTENSWYLDFFAKNLVGSYDTTKFGSIPTIYVGLFPLVLALLFFTFNSIKWQVKLAYIGLITSLIASFYLQPLDLFWQGMHAPNMFLHRYSWIFSTIIIYMAAETLVRLQEISLKKILTPFLFLLFGFTTTYLLVERYEFLNAIHFILTIEFLVAYGLLLFILVRKKITIHFFAITSLCFVLFEISLNTNYQIEGLSSEWHFPSRTNYEQNLTEIDTLVTSIKEVDKQFFRTERLFPQTGNDSMKYNYNGVSQFSSIRNRASSDTLDKLGFRSDGTNLNLRYQNNTLIADSLFAIKYNLAEFNPQKFGFSTFQTEGSMTAYQNAYALPLAILTNDVYTDVKFTNLTLDNQTNFLNQLTGFNLHYYYTLQPLTVENASELNNRITVNKIDGDELARVQYTLHIPANSQLYVNLPNLQFTDDANKNVQITINNVSTNYTLDNTFSIFSTGYYADEQEITLTISFPNNSQVSFDKPEFYQLDLNAYRTAINHLLEKNIAVTSQGNTVTANYSNDKNASIVLTIPYDKGWSARLNGKKVAISRAQRGFMKVDVPAGEGKLVLTFIPQGLKLGILAFVIGIGTVFLYEYFLRKRYYKKEN